MEEQVENIAQVQEIATPQTNSHEISHDQPPQVARATQADLDDTQEKNWRAVREKTKELERELRMQREMNEKLLQMATQNAPKPVVEVDEFDQIGDNEFIDKGKIKQLVEKRAAKIAQGIAQKETEKFFRQQEESQFIDKLKRKYSDFDDVVNSETIAVLEETNPELAQTIADLKDPYKMGVQTYSYIKALNLAEKVPQARRAREIDQKLEKNAKTVQTPQAYEKRPMAQAFKMTEAERGKIYEEMMSYASQSGFSY